MFRSRTAEMLYRSLSSFTELEAEEEKECQMSASASELSLLSDEFFLNPSIDICLLISLAPFDPSDPFWASLNLSLVIVAASFSYDRGVSSKNPLIGPGS
jgi:hypothetical protein